MLTETSESNAHDAQPLKAASQTVQRSADLLPPVWFTEERNSIEEFVPAEEEEFVPAEENVANDTLPSEDDSEKKIAQTVEALLADWERQDSRLEKAQFDRTVVRRKLDAEEIVAVIRRLRDRGINPTELGVEEDDVDEAATSKAVSEYANRPEFVAAYGRAALLSHDEHIRLTRAVQIGLLAQKDIDAGVQDPDLDQLVAEGERARSRMVTANIRLVFSIAHKSRKGNLDFTGPCPERHHRLDARGRNVRPRSRIALLDLWSVVDSTVDRCAGLADAVVGPQTELFVFDATP